MFLTTMSSKEYPQATAKTTDNQKWKHSRFMRQYCHFRLPVVVAITWRHLYRARHGRKGFAVEISTLFVIVPEI